MSRDNYRNRTENCSVTFCYNEVQNSILRLLFIAVVVTSDLCFKRVPNNKVHMDIKSFYALQESHLVFCYLQNYRRRRKKVGNTQRWYIINAVYFV
jgi:hypothetical protein